MRSSMWLEGRREAQQRCCSSMTARRTAYGGDKWIPVLDGDPTNDYDGTGWVQVGDQNRLGKNHKEAHHAHVCGC